MFAQLRPTEQIAYLHSPIQQFCCVCFLCIVLEAGIVCLPDHFGHTQLFLCLLLDVEQNLD